MSNEGDDIPDPNAPAFWTLKPDRVTKIQWQEAVSDYLTGYDKEPEELKHSVELVK